MNTPVKVAIVGCGHVALKEHLPAIREQGGEVAAFVDSVPELAKARAREFGVPHAFTDIDSLLAAVDVSVVAICTPPQAHRDLALAAIRAGKHLFMEKPPTLSAAAISEVADAARAAGVFVLAGSHHPYRENVVELRRRIAAGELGEVYAVDCFKMRRDAAPIDPGGDSPGMGVAAYSSIHRIDVALFLLGNPAVAYVTARIYNHFTLAKSRSEGVAQPSGAVEDSLIATIHFRDGCTLTLRDLHGAHLPEPNDMQCWFGDLAVFGTRAGAQLHPLTLFQTQADGGQTSEVLPVSNDLHDSHGPAYRYLFDCIQKKRTPEGTLDRAVAAMRILDALYASARANGQQVMVDA